MNHSITLTTDEKIRLFNGDGNWETYSASGKLPHIFMSDGPHGLRKQGQENYADINHSKRATCFPTASCIASSWDTNIAELLGKAIATEAKAENVQLVLGPGMNIKRSPLCGRNFEYFSEDPFLTGRMAAAYVSGMQSKGVGSCIKHFACNNQEKRRQTSSSNVDEKTLRKIYLSAFEYVIKNSKPAAVMCSYNKLNGTYTAHNRHLLTEILRDQWNYQGVVISDWGACINPPECLKAGMDLAMPDSHGYFDKQLKAALESGQITQEHLDRANNRVISMCKNLGGEKVPLASAQGASATPLSGAPETPEQPRNAPVDFNKQHTIALSLAQQSAVLLQNDGFFPLETKPNAPVFIIGELAKNMKFQGGGSSHISTANFPDALESFAALGFNVIYEPGYYSGFCKRTKAKKKNQPLINKALNHLKTQLKDNPELPVLFFCGLTEAFEGEGFDRTTLELPEEQLMLLGEVLKLTKNVGIVSFSGAPVNLLPAQNARAILHMYLCGEACGEAVASLVTGKVNPSGKLAETWPLKVEDTPCYKNFALDGDQVNYQEQELIGYRWYNAKNIPVQYPFGYGLSYTTFSVTPCKDSAQICNCSEQVEGAVNLLIPLSQVQVNIKNTGSRPGAQVVQVYYKGELCGFKKEFLNPGEERIIIVETDTSSINGYDNFSSQIEYGEQKTETAEFTLSSSLGDMAKKSLRIKLFLKVIRLALVIMNKKSSQDPSVKIQIAAIEENPVESLISTSGGIINEKFAKLLVGWAN